MRFMIPLTLVTLAMCLTAACGRDWLPTAAQACVFDSDCVESQLCFNSRCIQVDTYAPDGGIHLLGFGESCTDNPACESGYCLPHPQGGFCTSLCPQGCPAGFVCMQVPDPRGGSDRLGLCGVSTNRLCRPCVSDLECNPSGSDLCTQFEEGRFCLTDCWYGACPPGYNCEDVSHSSGILRQCRPLFTCTCTEPSTGMVRGCERSNPIGTCSGYELCQPPAGWTDCSAVQPAPEVCNGIDDDCDGFIDEQLQAAACNTANVFGICSGQEECRGLDGWICTAAQPAPETCDGLDNDCDSATDEEFKDAQGRYLDDANCGACGTDCAVMIPHVAEAVCRLVDAKAVCRAVSCEPGYFVYDEGTACLLLPDKLCDSCSLHADCLAPGSLCVQDGSEQYCGRDCSEESLYGPGCPLGYVCSPHAGVMQCLPASGTCLCTEETQATVRSCLVDTCIGYQECRQDGSLFTWSPCNVDDFNVEICDGLDNNCNGQVDEGFLNPQTGRYESDDHCGFCNNDCSLYWSEPIDHTTGVCEVDAPGMPTCMMGPCSQEQVDGLTYEWVDVDADTDNGCECRRVLGNTLLDLPDLIGEPQPGLAYLDENCDGVDGVVEHAIFVRRDAPADGNGSMLLPFNTISRAINDFSRSNKSYILVAEGTYDESITLTSGLALHGGYSADFRARDVMLYASVIAGVESSYAVAADGIVGVETLLSGFVIHGRNMGTSPADGADGTQSVAVRLTNSDEALVVRSSVIVGGRGGDGGPGSSGDAGFGRQDSADLDGNPGTNGLRRSGTCPSGYQHPGGPGGHNQVCATSDGNRGGKAVCPHFDWSTTPFQGEQAEYHSDAYGNGLGGYDWSFDELSTYSCSHATESGYPTAPQLNVGHDGLDGSDGDSGLGGLGGRGGYGSISDLAWVPALSHATPGTEGLDGHGGGGGGGGGGTAYYHENFDNCEMHEVAPSGGGGGAGGCLGQGGRPGGAGGASIAVFVGTQGGDANTAGPTLVHNVIQRGAGGRGGAGGFGGMGGLGGVGGFGGLPPDWISSLGGKGGDGGNGGPGGGGGGGVGGPSFGVLAFGVSVEPYPVANAFVFDDTVPTSGPGGAGGISVGSGATGEQGIAGAFQNLLMLMTCPTTGCPAGSACDGYGVCVPSER